ncbi:hypothetical protein BX616_008096 [Lobosporangium transversale]|uniref:Uncharacterized protein n=1 Tax=Lobosporangium transversale TaxID=64571 RepID=A0A1Y2GEY2_9FUNG|nr:hypothetical protein BCR41DRAFT_399115 [Lobosporangium transversale]KAF9914535.1 hypothetical protein BX616_008096 [Lobosporangium transversale]ORZ08850.1 hypothetical protein BCR41DRAFT_399115 [Lobosporangium transversale]|eukprot:XP_021878633.1 hypothetical protein BCR41DRAFT_399115 [Lobosporangium transversale]
MDVDLDGLDNDKSRTADQLEFALQNDIDQNTDSKELYKEDWLNSGDGGGSEIKQSTGYEIRPRIVVYNMGMGPTKRKKRRFKALIEAGLIDEVIDFEFNNYPSFWQLDAETRGQYGWKVGMIEEISQRILTTASASAPKNQPAPPVIAVAANPGSASVPVSTPNPKLEMQGLSDISDKTYPGSPTITIQPQNYEPKIVLWLDSGNRISVAFLRWLPTFLKRYGLWTPESQGTMRDWTHQGLLQYYHDSWRSFAENETNCNGAVVAFDVHNTTIRDGIMKEWVNCARTKECIAPEGSSRENHRQDQAALTYLVKTMGYGDEVCHGFPNVFGVQVNQDRFCKEDIASNSFRVFSN